jgi:hypothetical protein
MTKDKAEETVTEDKTEKVRILAKTIINGIVINAGHVAEILTSKKLELIENGQADGNQEAIAYALTEYPEIINTITE